MAPTARLLAVALVVYTTGCLPAGQAVVDSPKQESDTLWLWAEDPAHDGVHASDTEADLIRRYGAANVRRDSVNVGEGFFVRGAVIFPDDSLGRMEVIWGDSINFAEPRVARVQDYNYRRQPASRWVAWPGISLGTCLEEVERINGGPFVLFGFAFDGSGTVHSWEKGRLDTLWKSDPREKRVWISLEPAAGAPIPRQIAGDRLISSRLPATRAAKPCVREISVVPR